MRKIKRILSFAIVALVLLIVWIAWGNTALELTTYSISSDRLPKAFDGFRIAQISDLHNAEMGKENEKLISMLEASEPDLIVITGDMIDASNTNLEIALAFAKKAVQIAPCYYVTGNHEAGVDEYTTLKQGLLNLGVTVLEDEKTKIEWSGESITLVGVSDPGFGTDPSLDDATAMQTTLQKLISEEDGYLLLLSHRPELFTTYVENQIDLVLSGHAHGGQFRLPLIGGVIAPNQGLFPAYDAGIYSDGITHMVVSRGIGNSIIPFRVNNRPEVILIELAAQ